MSELGDYNSSLTAEQIESKLVGSIVFNDTMALTETQKSQARANIGAGTTSSGLQIKGFFESYESLASSITNPKAGDSYAVGAEEPYNIYIWDGLNKLWIANGFIRGADGTDADVTAENIALALGYTPLGADGSVTRAKLAQDALISPIKFFEGSSYSFTANDVGYTVANKLVSDDATERTVNLSYDVSHGMAEGTVLAVTRLETNAIKISFDSKISIGIMGETDWKSGITISIPDRFSTIALLLTKKTSSMDYWLLTGLAEIAT